MKDKLLFIYYFVLMLILALSVNMSITSNNFVRLAYLAALVAPLISNTAYFPAVIISALCVVKNAFTLVLVPTELSYYTLLAVIFCVISLRRQGFKTRFKYSLFVLPFLYICLNDVLYQGSFSQMASVLFLMALVYLCAEGDLEVSSNSIPLAFLFTSLTISYWMLFCPDARINLYNSAEGMEQETWADPNYLGCALGLGLVLSVKELVSGVKNRFYLYLLILTVAASSFALLSLASRGMTIAVSLSVLMLLLFSKVKKRTKIITITAVVLFALFLYNHEYADFLVARFRMADETGGNRVGIWVTKLSAFFSDNNIIHWLFGHGQTGGTILGTNRSTHNDFISILLYYGFIGLVLFICTLIYPIAICSKKARPQIAALILYLALCSMSIEPFAFGNVAYIGFLFFVILIARKSQQGETIN